MSHIGKTPLKLPANFTIAFQDDSNTLISWNQDTAIVVAEVPLDLPRKKAVLNFTGLDTTFNTEIPVGFCVKIYPYEALTISKDNRYLRTSKEVPAFLTVRPQPFRGKLKKGPQRRYRKKMNALWGTAQSALQTSIASRGGFQTLNITLKGLGYKAHQPNLQRLDLRLGFSHAVKLRIPEGVKVDISSEAITSDSQLLRLTSLSKQALGSFGSTIRYFRPPEPYKGKGVLWQTIREEQKFLLRRKAGKEGK